MGVRVIGDQNVERGVKREEGADQSRLEYPVCQDYQVIVINLAEEEVVS